MWYEWQDLFVALALVFVIEGVLPFLRPEAWRRTMGRIATKPDQAVRLIGFLSMMTGVVLLYIIRH
jgi:uncharacterized protein